MSKKGYEKASKSLSYEKVWELLNSNEEFHDVINNFSTKNPAANEDFYTEYMVETMPDILSEYDLTDVEQGYIIRNMVEKASVIHTAENLMDEYSNSHEFEFTDNDKKNILCGTKKSFDSFEKKALNGNANAIICGRIMAKLHGFNISDDSPLAAQSLDAPEDIGELENQISKIGDSLSDQKVFLNSFQDEYVLLKSTAKALNEEDEALNNAEHEVMAISITKEEYLADPNKKYDSPATVIDERFRYDKEEHPITPVEFTESAEIEFGWRKVSSWSDSSFKDNGVQKTGDLLYNDPTEKSLRTSNYVVDPKSQDVTESMIKTDLIKRYNDLSKSEVRSSIQEDRNGILAHLFGNGDPRAAYKCFLDKAALKNGVYMLDENKVQKMQNLLSDKNLDTLTNDVFKELPPFNTVGEKLSTYMNGTEYEKPSDTYSSAMLDEYEETHKNGLQLKPEQVDNLCENMIEMQEKRDARPWHYFFRHPINYIKEGLFIRDSRKTLVDRLGVDPDMIDVKKGREIIEDRRSLRAEEQEQQREENKLQKEIKKEQAEMSSQKNERAVNLDGNVYEGDVKEAMDELRNENPQVFENDREPMELDLGENFEISDDTLIDESAQPEKNLPESNS